MLDEVPAVDSLVTREPHDGCPACSQARCPNCLIGSLNTSQSSSQTSASSRVIMRSRLDQQSVDDETIIITAPFEIFDPSVEIPAARPQTRTTPDENFPPHNDVIQPRPDVHKQHTVTFMPLRRPLDINQPEEMNEPLTARHPVFFGDCGPYWHPCSAAVPDTPADPDPGTAKHSNLPWPVLLATYLSVT